VLEILHERHFAQALRDAVIVHQHRGVVTADLRDRLDQCGRQVELAALPVAGKILRTFLDAAVLLDDAGARDADERRKLEAFFVSLLDQALQHLCQLLYCGLARRLLVGMTPQLRFPDASLRQILCLVLARLDHTATNVGAADVNREDRVVCFEDP
jgi:hypothetical protein